MKRTQKLTLALLLTGLSIIWMTIQIIKTNSIMEIITFLWDNSGYVLTIIGIIIVVALLIKWKLHDRKIALNETLARLTRAAYMANLKNNFQDIALAKIGRSVHLYNVHESDMKLFSKQEIDFLNNYDYRNDINIPRPLTNYPKELNDAIERFVKEYYEKQK